MASGGQPRKAAKERVTHDATVTPAFCLPCFAAMLCLYPQAHGGRRPWRNGRHVSRTRCRHAASIYDCPHGPERCWFWHDEDGDPDSD